MNRPAKFDGQFPSDALRITKRHFVPIVLAFTSILAALILHQFPDNLRLALIFSIPAIMVGILILKNPFVGVYLYFLYNFLRPYDFIPALLPLRLAMVIEVITLISWILQLISTGKRFRWSNFNWLFLGFLAVIALTTVTAMNNRSAYDIFQAMAVIFVMFVISTNVVDTEARLHKLVWLLLLIHFYFALKGIYNYAVLRQVTGGMQTSGSVGSSFIGDENDFALALNVMIPFVFFMLAYIKGKMQRFMSVVLLFTFMFAVVCSFSRGGWVGFVVVILFCILKSKKKMLSIMYALAISAALIAVAPSSYWDEIKTISDTKEATADSRIRYWKAAGRMYLDYPIVGVGAGNGGFHMPSYIVGTRNPHREWGRAFHGTLPQVLAELGTLGMAFYLLMLFFILKSLFAIKRRRGSGKAYSYRHFMAISIIGALIGYFASATFLSTAYYPQLWTLYTLAGILVYLENSKSTVSSENNAERLNRYKIKEV